MPKSERRYEPETAPSQRIQIENHWFGQDWSQWVEKAPQNGRFFQWAKRQYHSDGGLREITWNRDNIVFVVSVKHLRKGFSNFFDCYPKKCYFLQSCDP